MTATAMSYFTYDDNGNMTSKVALDGSVILDYTYDAENRLRTISVSGSVVTPRILTFSYDVFGRRISRSVDGQERRFAYDGDAILYEFDGTNDLICHYLHGKSIDEPLIVYYGKEGQTQLGNLYSYFQNWRGDVEAIVDGEGQYAVTYRLDSFGNIIEEETFPTTTPDFENRYLFTGREFDELYTDPVSGQRTGIHYFRSRYYDPELGRFIQEDPIGFAGGDTNLYSYVLNDPIILRDPFGLDAEGWTQFFHTGYVFNFTSECVLVSGNNPDGKGQLQYYIPPWTLFQNTPFPSNDIDAVYYGNQLIKIHGIVGSWIHLPSWLRPNDYNSDLGWLLRGFGWNQLIDPNKEPGFNRIVPPSQTSGNCKCQ